MGMARTEGAFAGGPGMGGVLARDFDWHCLYSSVLEFVKGVIDGILTPNPRCQDYIETITTPGGLDPALYNPLGICISDLDAVALGPVHQRAAVHAHLDLTVPRQDHDRFAAPDQLRLRHRPRRDDAAVLQGLLHDHAAQLADLRQVAVRARGDVALFHAHVTRIQHGAGGEVTGGDCHCLVHGHVRLYVEFPGVVSATLHAHAGVAAESPAGGKESLQREFARGEAQPRVEGAEADLRPGILRVDLLLEERPRRGDDVSVRLGIVGNPDRGRRRDSDRQCGKHGDGRSVQGDRSSSSVVARIRTHLYVYTNTRSVPVPGYAVTRPASGLQYASAGPESGDGAP
jgi:hypothetical protein